MSRQEIIHDVVLAMAALFVTAAANGIAADDSLDAGGFDSDPQARSDGSSTEATAGTLFYEWINDYPGEEDDLDHCDEDAEGLRDQLEWDYSGYMNDSAWEEDFKISSRGGKEYDFVDQDDFAYFSGHGSKQGDRRTANFSTNHDDEHLRPADCEDGWGDQNLEWVAFNACKIMKDSAYWASCMDGLHLILGWETDSYDVDLGTPFGANMVKDGDSDTALKIKQSWFQAADDSNPEDLIAVVIGETYEMGDDYVWGEGTVGDDPAPDEYHYRWEHTTTSSESSSRQSQAPAQLGDPSLEQIEASTSSGYTVIYDPGLGDSLPAGMDRYPVVPVTVDATYVQAIADAIDTTLGGRMGGATLIGQDRSGNYTMSDVDDYLFVSQATGAATLIDTARWLAAPAASLPSEAQALTDSVQLLTDLGRLPTGYTTQTLWDTGAAVEDDTGIVQGSVENYDIEIGFRRQLASYPVTGPGAKIAVVYGDGGYLERWSEGGWRQVGTPEPISLVPWEDVLAVLTTHGSGGTIDGITIPADTILVNDISVGYYEFDRWTQQQYIEPIYILDATLNPGIAEEDNFTIHMNALRTPPTASIDFPTHGSWFHAGTPISLQASATGGAPPYIYDWWSDVDGPLGSDSWIEILLSVALKDSTVVMHSITVTITDSAGATARQSIAVGVKRFLPSLSTTGLIILAGLLPGAAAVLLARRRQPRR